jgi:hypothetical protein
MFGFFKSKNEAQELSHVVFFNKAGKYKHLASLLLEAQKAGDATLLIYHFDDTASFLKQLFDGVKISFAENDFGSPVKLYIFKAETLKQTLLTALNKHAFKTVLISEIHPMAGKDELLSQLIHEKTNAGTVRFYTSLDSPLFTAFGGTRLQDLMLKMGIKEDEPIEHNMVSQSIKRAQEKIKEKVVMEKNAASEAEWIKLNIPSGL